MARFFDIDKLLKFVKKYWENTLKAYWLILIKAAYPQALWKELTIKLRQCKEKHKALRT